MLFKSHEMAAEVCRIDRIKAILLDEEVSMTFISIKSENSRLLFDLSVFEHPVVGFLLRFELIQFRPFIIPKSNTPASLFYPAQVRLNAPSKNQNK